MKFALFDFFEENCVEIGESSWICDEREDLPPFDEETWPHSMMVMVEWRTSGNKRHRGKKFPAKVISFSGENQYTDITSCGEVPSRVLLLIFIIKFR